MFCTGRTFTTGLLSLAQPRHIGDCSAIHFLHSELCDLQKPNHRNFPLCARLRQRVFCKKPCHYGLQAHFTILDPSESAYTHCADPNPVPRVLVAPMEVHETNWKCLHFSLSSLPDALRKYFHQPNSPCIPVANQAIHAIYLFVPLSFPFSFGFRFLWNHATGLTEALHSYLHFFLILELQHNCFPILILCF